MTTYWDNFKSLYQHGEQKHRMYLMQLLNELKIVSLLDVGCGTGPIGEIIIKHAYPIKYKGIDYSSSMIKVAKDNFPTLEWETGDMRKLNEKDNSWECVLLMHSLDHTNDYKSAIAEATRVSSKYVCIVLWRSLLEDGSHLNSVNKMDRTDDKSWDDTHLQEYSMQILEKEFKKNKLNLETVINDSRINEDRVYNTLFLLKK